MGAYSNDLRERVIAAWEEGQTQAWIAKTYRVSSGTVKRYMARYRATGTVAPTVQGRMQPLITVAHEALLGDLVAQLDTLW
jgi:transposase